MVGSANLSVRYCSPLEAERFPRWCYVVMNPPADAGDAGDAGSIPGSGRSTPWRRAGEPTPVFLPGESPWTEEAGGLQSPGVAQTRTPALKSSAMLRSTVLGCGEVSGRDRRQDSGKLPFLGPEHRGLPEQLWLPSRPTWAGDDGGVRAERVLERSVKGLWHLCLPSHMVLALSLSRQSCCHRAGWVNSRQATTGMYNTPEPRDSEW